VVVWAEDLKVLQTVIRIISVLVMQVDWNLTVKPFLGPSANLALSLFDAAAKKEPPNCGATEWGIDCESSFRHP
jgi:hypothetical protein